MKLIVGLGNPGKKYEKTRHNIGFRVLNEIANDLLSKSRTGFKFVKKFNAEILEKKFIPSNDKIIFIKPQTFMNKSGEAVLKLLKFYKIKPSDVVIVHDELDLDFGKIRESFGSRSAGHNGVQSVIDALGTKNFTRVRIGIGPAPERTPAEKFVLQKFGREEEKELKKIIEKTIKIIEKLVL